MLAIVVSLQLSKSVQLPTPRLPVKLSSLQDASERQELLPRVPAFASRQACNPLQLPSSILA